MQVASAVVAPQSFRNGYPASTVAASHVVKQASEQPPRHLVMLLFSFRGVAEVEVPADRIHADK